MENCQYPIVDLDAKCGYAVKNQYGRLAMKWIFLTFFTIAISIINFGCTSVQPVPIPRQWTRQLGDPTSIKLNSTIQVEVKGQTDPMVGGEELIQHELELILSDLLVRRGNNISNIKPDIKMILFYKTERAEKTKLAMYSSSNSDNVNYFGIGVRAAQNINASSMGSQAEINYSKETWYTHTIAIEAFRAETAIWKGESTWDSKDPDILKESKSALQYPLANLIKDNNHAINIQEVKESHLLDYFTIKCKRRWLTCPGLPYRVAFPRYIGYMGAWNYVEDIKELPKYIQNRENISAYIDLVETAESALPNGIGDSKNLFDTKIWNEITLGGLYAISGKTKKIIILLSITPVGYITTSCKEASDYEWRKYQSDLEIWNSKLRENWSMYKN
jgi:hypothetical protein